MGLLEKVKTIYITVILLVLIIILSSISYTYGYSRGVTSTKEFEIESVKIMMLTDEFNIRAKLIEENNKSLDIQINELKQSIGEIEEKIKTAIMMPIPITTNGYNVQTNYYNLGVVNTNGMNIHIESNSYYKSWLEQPTFMAFSMFR